MIKTLILILLFIFPAGALAQQDLSQVAIQTTPIRDHVAMLIGSGGNIGVSAGIDGVLIVDDQFAPLVPKIEKALKKLSAKPVQFVINTHFHPDHTGGNEPLGKGGAVIVAHQNVGERLSRERFNSYLQRTLPAEPKEALPVITFTQDITFHFNGDDIEVHHVDPAHTDGDSFIYFKKAKVLHSGDLFFNGSYPFIDLDAGGPVDGMIVGADRMLKVIAPDTQIIPGHGPLADVQVLRDYRKMLAAIAERVRKMKKQGKNLQEVLAANPSAEFDAQWGGGLLKPDGFVTQVFESLP